MHGTGQPTQINHRQIIYPLLSKMTMRKIKEDDDDVLIIQELDADEDEHVDVDVDEEEDEEDDHDHHHNEGALIIQDIQDIEENSTILYPAQLNAAWISSIGRESTHQVFVLDAAGSLYCIDLNTHSSTLLISNSWEMTGINITAEEPRYTFAKLLLDNSNQILLVGAKPVPVHEYNADHLECYIDAWFPFRWSFYRLNEKTNQFEEYLLYNGNGSLFEYADKILFYTNVHDPDLYDAVFLPRSNSICIMSGGRLWDRWDREPENFPVLIKLWKVSLNEKKITLFNKEDPVKEATDICFGNNGGAIALDDRGSSKDIVISFGGPSLVGRYEDVYENVWVDEPLMYIIEEHQVVKESVIKYGDIFGAEKIHFWSTLITMNKAKRDLLVEGFCRMIQEEHYLIDMPFFLCGIINGYYSYEQIVLMNKKDTTDIWIINVDQALMTIDE